MNLIQRRAMVAIAGSGLLMGCAKGVEVAATETGTLVQGWSIEGVKDVSQCNRYFADRIRVVLYREDGTIQASEFESCGLFQLDTALPLGLYSGSATFLDIDGNAVSRTLSLSTFNVGLSQVIVRELDFTSDDMQP